MSVSDNARQWIEGPEAQAVFKAAWHAQDRTNKRTGLADSRVEAGLAAVAGRFAEVEPYL